MNHTFSLKHLLVLVLGVVWLILSFYPATPNASVEVVDTGAEYVVQQQREYGWPGRCVVTRLTSTDFDRPEVLDHYAISETRFLALLGNLAAVVLIFACCRYLFFERTHDVDRVSDREAR